MHIKKNLLSLNINITKPIFPLNCCSLKSKLKGIQLHRNSFKNNSALTNKILLFLFPHLVEHLIAGLLLVNGDEALQNRKKKKKIKVIS